MGHRETYAYGSVVYEVAKLSIPFLSGGLIFEATAVQHLLGCHTMLLVCSWLWRVTGSMILGVCTWRCVFKSLGRELTCPSGMLTMTTLLMGCRHKLQPQ
jgi:hypothetical protein